MVEFAVGYLLSGLHDGLGYSGVETVVDVHLGREGRKKERSIWFDVGMEGATEKEKMEVPWRRIS